MDIWSKDVEQFIQEELEKPFFLSIGLYEHSEDEFFGRLLSEHVDTFCDLRQRRSTRNPAYAFANSRRLQQTLSDLGIRYFHCKELAPSRETRAKQRAEDKRLRLKKRERCALEQAFIEAYEQECLATFDSHAFMQRLGPEAHVIALFCVENEELACHRWLV